MTWTFLSRAAGLAAISQGVVGKNAGEHGFTDRYGPDADARIVAALGADIDVLAVLIDGTALAQDRGGRLDREAGHHRHAGRNAAKNAAGVVGKKLRLAVVAHAHLVGIFLAGDFGG